MTHKAVRLAMIYRLSQVSRAQTLSIVNFPSVSLQRAWALTPVTLMYVSNVAFALMGLQNLNIPMYNTLKRLTPVIVLTVKVRDGMHCTPGLLRAGAIVTIMHA